MKNSSSNRVIDLKKSKSIQFMLLDNLLSFRDTGKIFELKGDLLKMITNKNYNVDHAKLSVKKLLYDFAKERNFDVKGLGRKSTRDRTQIFLLKSPGLLDSASGNSKKNIFII